VTADRPPTRDDGTGEEGVAPDTGPLPEAAVSVLARALERATAAAFKSANRRGQDKRGARLWKLSMSGLGGCPREAAYRLAEVEPSDPALAYDREARQAQIGVWIHEGLLPEFEEVLHHAEIELPVELRVPVKTPDGQWERELVVPGTTDCYSRVMGGGVLDVKTVYAYHLGDVDHEGAHEAHRKQVRGYATALRQMGLPVAWVAWLYLDRSSGEELVMVEPFDEQAEVETEDHVRWLWSLRQAPDHAPRGERGPGLSVVCDGCAWLKQCWGPDAESGDSRALRVHDRPEIEMAGRQYKELGAQIKALTEQQEVYGAMVGRPDPGAYGEIVIGYQGDGEKTDAKEAERLLGLHGIEVPKKPRRGNRLIRWGVTKK
jgi:hypothetical protein